MTSFFNCNFHLLPSSIFFYFFPSSAFFRKIELFYDRIFTGSLYQKDPVTKRVRRRERKTKEEREKKRGRMREKRRKLKGEEDEVKPIDLSSFSKIWKKSQSVHLIHFEPSGERFWYLWYFRSRNLFPIQSLSQHFPFWHVSILFPSWKGWGSISFSFSSFFLSSRNFFIWSSPNLWSIYPCQKIEIYIGIKPAINSNLSPISDISLYLRIQSSSSHLFFFIFLSQCLFSFSLFFIHFF